MVLRRRHHDLKAHERIINIQGDNIKIVHVGFECSDTAWNAFQKILTDKYKGNSKMKSVVIRILLNALILGIVNIDDLETKVNEKAEKVKDIVYI